MTGRPVSSIMFILFPFSIAMTRETSMMVGKWRKRWRGRWYDRQDVVLIHLTWAVVPVSILCQRLSWKFDVLKIWRNGHWLISWPIGFVFCKYCSTVLCTVYCIYWSTSFAAWYVDVVHKRLNRVSTSSEGVRSSQFFSLDLSRNFRELFAIIISSKGQERESVRVHDLYSQWQDVHRTLNFNSSTETKLTTWETNSVMSSLLMKSFLLVPQGRSTYAS